MKKRILGQVLKNHRVALAMTQRELATKLNVKPSQVAYLETGRRRPSSALLGRIA
jgi:transcriptional regulator with XRE-family HTH domain